MKLPVWIIAISFLVGAAFIGYGVYDNRNVDLWPPKIHSKKDQFYSKTTDGKYLKNFAEVLEQSTKLINTAHSEFWMAVDVPAYGAITLPKEFQQYENALHSIAIRSDLSRNILWFGKETENKYNVRVAKLNSGELSFQNKNGARLRKSLSDSIESDLPVLSFHNFWIAQDKNGTYHSVISWFALDEVRSSELIGLYSTSPDVAKLLKGVWGMWKKQSKEGFSKSLIKLYRP